jgi:hypothetical protein
MRTWITAIALGGLALVGGCAAEYYDGPYGYVGGYYGPGYYAPGYVVRGPYHGYYRGYYGRPYYYNRGYYARPYYHYNARAYGGWHRHM